ncbi:MAG: outer membrane beta-barrel protein [Endomicrobia bacterium]|nr:outer membrane beta-barrel protein [Endomicrobiia bacterium]
MKKIFSSIVLLSFASNMAFADFNARIGAGLINSFSFSSSGYGSYVVDADIDFNTSIEYLYKINEMFRVGPGIEFAIGTKDKNDSVQAANIPFYVSLECHPFKETEEIFFRGNIGYTYFNFDRYIGNETVIIHTEYKSKGGIYYALGAGYAFKFGLIVDLTYGFYHGSFYIEDIYTGTKIQPDVNITLRRFALNAGYKFKI